jgi:probable rRNA maturation factor
MIVIQNSINDAKVNEPLLCRVIQNVIDYFDKGDFDVLIRIVDKEEICLLNNTYRKQDKSTNVLSFESNLPIEVDEKLLGDVVICTKVVMDEAKEQNKSFNDHLIHITIHGTLHLLGYDHIKEDDAKIMESLEIDFLKKIGVNNPYS